LLSAKRQVEGDAEPACEKDYEEPDQFQVGYWELPPEDITQTSDLKHDPDTEESKTEDFRSGHLINLRGV
jgi:hypothetical protein